MFLGLTGDKGRVHLHFSETVKWQEVEGERQEKVLADLVDKAIFKGYKIFPNQILAANYLGYNTSSEFNDADVRLFKKRIESVIAYVGKEFSKEEITKKWCEITAEPLLAKRAQSSE